MQFPETDELSTERGWQDQANCLGVDPDLFSLKGVLLLVKQKKCVVGVSCEANALSTH